MGAVVTLTTVRSALVRVRSASHLAPTQPRMNVRMLFAIVALGHLRHRDEIGGWAPGSGAMSWRSPSAGRRNLLIEAVDSLFGFPTSKLVRHRGDIRRKKGTKDNVTHHPAPNLPDRVALAPLMDLPPRPSSPRPCRVVFRQKRWWSVPVDISDSRWWWSTDDGCEAATKTEFNPGNTINTQQGVECFFPVKGLSRAKATEALAVPRPQCAHFSGRAGAGVCDASACSERCMAAGKQAIWPRVVLTNYEDEDQWGIGPEGFEALRQHVGTSTLGGLRADLALIAGTCEALRQGQDFSSGTVVIDQQWLRDQLATDAWEALRP